MASPRSFGFRPLICFPPMRILPEVSVSSPAMMRRSVVFPQPEGPSSETNSPSRISSDTSFSAWKEPNSLRTRSMTMSAMDQAPLFARNAPDREQVAPDREDEEHRGKDEKEASGEAVVHR